MSIEFKYRISPEGAIIERCYGEETRVEIPEYLEGNPVIGLDAYVFSNSRTEPHEVNPICGEQLLEISLPRNLRRIGNYAFYGCRNLDKMTIWHQTKNIGGGVFTGCNKVRELRIYMEDAYGYCLKDITAELRHELHVNLFYEEGKEAKLLFPEYYEEAVENTPARILETRFHGSGYHYRQCFQNGSIHYTEYDALFFDSQYVESTDFCIELCLLRLQYPYQLSEEAKGCYQAWLMEHRMEAATWCIEFELNEEMEYLSTFIEWSTQELSDLIQESNHWGRIEIQSFLMDYKFRHQKRVKKTYEW